MDWQTVAIAAFVSAAAAHGPAASDLECVETGTSNGFPSGIQQSAETRYRVEGEGAQISVMKRGEPDQNICPPGATCAIAVSHDRVHVSVHRIPDADPLYSTSFHLDRKTLIFDAYGGGLDGGWAVSGPCRPSAR